MLLLTRFNGRCLRAFEFLPNREKVAVLESVESQMKAERRSRAESDAQLKELENRQSEAQLKSQQIISALKTQVAEQTQARVSLVINVWKGK